MKKILSTILTLTMLAVPFVAQCSASDESYTIYDNDNNCIICDNNIYCENDTHNYIDDKDNKVSTESQTNSQKPKRSSLKKAGSFCLKTLFGSSLLALAISPLLFVWSPKGEWAAAIRKLYDSKVVPNVNAAYSSTAQWLSNFYGKTLLPWLSNICVQKGDKGDCAKSLEAWFASANKNVSTKWNNLKNLCLRHNGEIDPVCDKTLAKFLSEYWQALKNNYYALTKPSK